MEGNKYVIVIGRQFGCGGRVIGKALASRLGIPYYDKELLRQAARRSGIAEDIFDRGDEKRPSMLASLLGFGYTPADGNYSTSTMSREGLYKAQSAVIRDITHAGPCVIVGRTADYVARDLDNLVSIFLHAPVEKRVSRIVSRGDFPTPEEARKNALRRDKMREDYYNFFTGRSWGHAANYHLCIDASSMKDEAIIDLIVDYLEHRHRPASESEH